MAETSRFLRKISRTSRLIRLRATEGPNFFVAVDASIAREKARALVELFPSQANKHWFSEDTFLALMRLRGVQSAATGGFAEAFYARKVNVR